LAALSVLTEKLERRLVAEKSRHVDMAQNIVCGVRDALHGVRAAARGLVPVPVESGGLAVALRALAQSVDEQERIRCTVDSDGDFRFTDDLKATHMFRIAQEAVSNAARHSQGSSIRIHLRCPDHSVSLEVIDDGVGIAEDAIARDGGLGLQTMRHRASVIGARLSVQRREEGGTLVRCVLPRNR
jgi:signal transduction histidine kinase